MTVDKSDRQRALSLTPVSRETEERLALLVTELGRWQAAKNLVSSATLADVWTRHIADSSRFSAWPRAASAGSISAPVAAFPDL